MNDKFNYINEIKKNIDISSDNIFFYWKGRMALYAILKAIGVKDGDEVVMPGFSCVVVPNAIKYLGATPIYVDIDRETLNPNYDNYKNAITSRTKVIIIQNTFGLSTQVVEIVALAKEKGIFTIEDCTHGFGGTYKGESNGSYCDSAFYSTQWNKPFSTGIGGFSIINNEAVLPKIFEVNKQLINPSIIDVFVLSVLLFANAHILTSNNYWRIRRLYRFLSKYNLVIGSSSDEELEGAVMPKKYFKGISRVQIKSGINNLKKLKDVLVKRKENAVKYTDFLRSKNKYHVKNELHSDHSFLKYPLLVNNREEFERRAEEAKIELGDWFCSPIHPVDKEYSQWDLDVAEIPIANQLSKQIVNLPSDTDEINRVLVFLDENIDFII